MLPGACIRFGRPNSNNDAYSKLLIAQVIRGLWVFAYLKLHHQRIVEEDDDSRRSREVRLVYNIRDVKIQMDKEHMVKCSQKCSQTPVRRVQIPPCGNPNCQDATTQVRARIPRLDEGSHSPPGIMDNLVKELRNHYNFLRSIMNEISTMHCENRRVSRHLVDIVTETMTTVHRLEGRPRSFHPKSTDPTSFDNTTQNEEEVVAQHEAQVSEMDTISQFGFKQHLSAQVALIGCPERCPSCGNTIKFLLAEIAELRKTRTLLIRVRDEANDILDSVIAEAMAQTRVVPAPVRNTAYKPNAEQHSSHK